MSGEQPDDMRTASSSRSDIAPLFLQHHPGNPSCDEQRDVEVDEGRDS